MPAPDSICDLVQRFQLGLHKRLAAAGSPQEKELQRQIAYTDREIDALVYELYGLTGGGIRIVEGGVGTTGCCVFGIIR
ncbi:hypothetical protein LARV_03795 [Longilinea arvoryzae]|uniref:Uncharacterized protein n=1 Tax=Longilinea arvoryzae TaxID=360412 RepID=A0A0K8MXS0_9CHLR|nr:hypothetical protein [Longilinea arvoryzae]GAP16000.1 hypothetical protein LARV_03795 [Longilinea arvoryzae]